MILDTSAMVAAVSGERSAPAVLHALADAGRLLMSAATATELWIVVDSSGSPQLSGEVDTLLRDLDVQIVPVTVDHARIARQAYRDYGNGRHPAALNLGDCVTYALAKQTGEPVLCVGDDFRRTDLDVVVVG